MKRFTELSGTGQAAYLVLGLIIAATIFSTGKYTLDHHEEILDSGGHFYHDMVVTYTGNLPNVTCHQWTNLSRKDQKILAARYMADKKGKPHAPLYAEASDGGSLIDAECLAYDFVTEDVGDSKTFEEEPLSVAIPIGRRGLLDPTIRSSVIDAIHAFEN